MQRTNYYEELTTFKIGFSDYLIILSDYIEIDGNIDYRGKFEFMDCRITLSNQMNHQRTRETLVHEIVHAIISESSTTELLGNNEEEFVNRFSKVLNQFLIDNTNFHQKFSEKILKKGELSHL